MKLLYQISIIFSITFVSELLHYFIPLPVPANIYGLTIMLILLCTGALKLHQVKIVASTLVEWMPLMLIPAAIGLIHVWDTLKPIMLPIVLITVVTTFFTMFSAGRASQAIINDKKRSEQ